MRLRVNFEPLLRLVEKAVPIMPRRHSWMTTKSKSAQPARRPFGPKKMGNGRAGCARSPAESMGASCFWSCDSGKRCLSIKRIRDRGSSVARRYISAVRGHGFECGLTWHPKPSMLRDSRLYRPQGSQLVCEIGTLLEVCSLEVRCFLPRPLL